MGPSLDHHCQVKHTYDGWVSLERPLVTMISWTIGAKASMPREILKVDIGVLPMEVKAHAKPVSFIDSTSELT